MNRSGQEPAETLTQRWAALLQKVGEIALMAELSPEPVGEMNARFANALARTGALFGNHTHIAAERGIEDMEILIDMGLGAVKEVESRGQNPVVPALALWREVYHAREAVLIALEPVAA
ncbi:MAG: hypothetical protein ABJ205_08820 [Erythrobacter sp.]|uniref:hypothetical protein n=1 Tax=Erythrobacter sp. TaxID=1042 RepID=UPI0032670EDD